MTPERAVAAQGLATLLYIYFEGATIDDRCEAFTPLSGWIDYP